MPLVRRLLAVILLWTVGAAAALNQVKTEHFVVVFNDGYEYWAQQVILVAEEVWDNLATAYDLMDENKPIYIYIEDPGDYATGYAIPSRNKISVAVTALDIGIRSSDNWIRNVVTHELAHVFSIKTANKDGFLKNWWVGRSSAYSNPDISVAFHYRDLLMPQWWSEGVAQYEAAKNGNDRWDTHRDMFLRMAVLEDDLLDYAEMSVFDSRNGFYPEMTYNQGFSLVRFIDSVYGEDAVRTATRAKSFHHFNHSLRRGTGHGGQYLYRQWKSHLKEHYGAIVEDIEPNHREGEALFDGGYWDYFGAYSPDGGKVALVSNEGYDVLYTHAYILDLANDDTDKIRSRGFNARHGYKPPGGYSYAPGQLPTLGRLSPPAATAASLRATGPAVERIGRTPVVLSRISWSPDGAWVCYARRDAGSRFRDIYLYNVDERREKRITWEARADDPAFSPDGKTIAYIYNDKGSQNLALIGSDGRRNRLLTNFNAGEQLFAPCWTPDGSRIVFGILKGGNRDIAIVKANAAPFDRMRVLEDSTFFPDTLAWNDDLDLMLLVHTAADERDPCVSPDGAWLYYSSDRTGIFNIYRMNMETWKVEQVTNVIGGAFAPSVHPDGARLLYTGFHAADYSLYEIDLEGLSAVELTYERKGYRERFDGPMLFAGSPENAQYRQGKYEPRFTLWGFEPYLSWQPTYITDSVGISQMRLGASLVAGELHGNLNLGGSAFISKDFDNGAGPSWGADLVLALKTPGLSGENRDFKPEAYVYGAREVVRDEFPIEPWYDTDETDFSRTPPDEHSIFVEPDTLVGIYIDGHDGVYSSERVFNQYGLSAGLSFGAYGALGLSYGRLEDYFTGSYYGYQIKQFGRLFVLDDPERFEGAVDLTDSTLSSPQARNAVDGWTTWLDEDVADTSGSIDIYEYFERFPIYNEHRLSLSYRFENVVPRALVPARVDYWAVGAQLIRSRLTVDSYYNGSDTLVEREGLSDLVLNIGPDGTHIPLVTPIEQERDFFSLELAGLERFPLPGNTLLGRLPRGMPSGHFLTLSTFLGSLNRRLPPEANTYPLEYRIAHVLKAYPYSFDPLELGPIEGAFAVDRYDARGNLIGTDSIRYAFDGDTSNGDIMWGNGIAYYGLEYTLELFRGLSAPHSGMLIEGLYLTPFFEAAAVWNSDWRSFDGTQLLPLTFVDGSPRWRGNFLRDFGIRAEVAFVLAHHWHGILGFTWARRLDLDDALVDIEYDGRTETRTYLDKDRFSLVLHLW